MRSYRNLSGNSGVTAFQRGRTYIRVEFSGESVYRYTHQSAGRNNIDEMKRLARQGEGLNSFINCEVRTLYEEREA